MKKIILLFFIVLATSCAVKQTQSRTEMYINSWETRDHSKISSFSGEEVSSLQPGVLLEFIACPEVVDEMFVVFGSGDATIGFRETVPEPLVQIFVSEETGQFPVPLPPNFVPYNKYRFLWENMDPIEVVANRCEEDGRERLAYGPIGDLEEEEWDFKSVEEGIDAMRANRKGQYEKLPLAAYAFPFILLIVFLMFLTSRKHGSNPA